ncbi:hypothetical protein Hanom_Chr05g00392081 [Helianthus anomalus]
MVVESINTHTPTITNKYPLCNIINPDNLPLPPLLPHTLPPHQRWHLDTADIQIPDHSCCSRPP